MSAIKISAVIITFNEEKNIFDCLNSLKNVADEIVIVDSFSTDKTLEICENFDIKIIQNKFEDFGHQKNFGNNLAQHNYILSLDADERVSDELEKSILDLKSNCTQDGFYINKKNYYAGKWLKYGGWYPNKRIRLFDKTKAKWEGKFHEAVKMFNSKTKVFSLKGDLIHIAFDSVKHQEDKIESYTQTIANQFFEEGKKSNWLQIIIKPTFQFVNLYFFKMGFLDGKLGFIVAKNAAHAKFLRYYKLKQLWKAK